MTPLPKNLQAKMEANAIEYTTYWGLKASTIDHYENGYKQCYSDLNDELSAKNATLSDLLDSANIVVTKNECHCDIGYVCRRCNFLDRLRKFREHGE